MGLASGTNNNCISQNFSNLIRTLSPLGGNCIGSDELDEFDVILTPQYLIVDDGYASTEDVYWYPPDGLEILDGDLEDEFFNPFTGADIAYYWVLLSDGSCVELKFVTDGSFPFITTTIDEVDETPPNPFVPYFYGSVSLVDGPLTVLGSNSVFRYDVSQKAWRYDSTGFNGAYVQSIAGDTSGRIFAAASSGLFMQQNTSLSWSKVSSFTASSPQVIFVDRQQRIYVATYSDVYYSRKVFFYFMKINMKIKRLFLAATAATLLVSSSTFVLAKAADNDGKFEKRIEHRIEKMKKKLNLTDQQVTQAKAIMEEAKPQMKADFKAMKDAPKDQKETLRAQFKKDREATKEKLMAILTPDQRTKAEKFFKKHEGKEHDEKNEK